MTIRNVRFGRNTATDQQVNTPQQAPQVVTSPITITKPDLISKEGANALRAYTLQQTPVSFQGATQEKFGTSKEYIEQLTSKGLKEGKDFTVDKDGKFTEVHLIKNGQTVKDMVWFQEDTGEVFECYRLQYHSQYNPKEGVTTCYGDDGEFRYRTKTYEKNPIKNDDVNVHITPKEYIEYLEQNNIKYTSDFEKIDDDMYNQTYSVYNPQTNLMTKIIFERNLNNNDNISVHKQIYNEDNEHTKTVHYYHDCTEITDFADNPKIYN